IVTVLLAAYGVLFVYSPGIAEYPLPTRLLWFAAATALIALLGPLIGEYVLFMVMFQAMTHVILLPWRWAVPSAILVCLAVAVISLWIQLYVAAGFAVVGLVMTLGIGHGIRQQVLQEQLGLAQRRNAVLAVAAERERIGRDLHDILGHSPTPPAHPRPPPQPPDGARRCSRTAGPHRADQPPGARRRASYLLGDADRPRGHRDRLGPERAGLRRHRGRGPHRPARPRRPPRRAVRLRDP